MSPTLSALQLPHKSAASSPLELALCMHQCVHGGWGGEGEMSTHNDGVRMSVATTNISGYVYMYICQNLGASLSAPALSES